MIKPFCYAYKENGEDFFAPKDGYYPADAVPLYTKDVLLQAIKELRPAILPLEGMGRGKTTQEWFDILVQDIEEKL